MSQKDAISLEKAKLSAARQTLLQKRLQGNAGTGSNRRLIPPRPPQLAEIPLSFAQQRLWFLSQLKESRSLYNVLVASRLLGPLNTAVLAQSINEIVRRHEILRTRFITVNGQPAQVVAPTLTLTLQVEDLRNLPADERQAEAQRLALAESQWVFDLSQGPLLRVTLFQLDREEHVLLLNMHHIITDGWSMGLFATEIMTLYEAFSNHKPSPLPALPIQYADFAYQQRQQLQGEALEKLLAYWKQQLAGIPPLLELPTDHPRTAVQRFEGATESLVLSQTLTEALKKLSQQEEATLFMTLLAAFKALLYGYTAQDDLAIGTRVANRDRVQTEGLIGFFLNGLVLRTDLTGNPTFRALIRRVRHVALEAYDHQELPFEKLVEELQPRRSPSHQPLFNVMFVLQTAPMPVLSVSNLTMRPFKLANNTVNYDLDFSWVETAHGLTGNLSYNTDLFAANTIQDLLEQLQAILTAVTNDPERPLDDLIKDTISLPPPSKQPIVNGYHIPLTHIQTVLNHHPLIKEGVVVVSDTDKSNGSSSPTEGKKQLVAYVVPVHDHELTAAQMRDFLKDKLPDYMLPASFVQLNALPLTPAGEVDFQALPAPVTPETAVAPRTPIETKIAAIWAEILQVESIGIYDNFFDMGGHSLLATQVISRILETYRDQLFADILELEGLLISVIFEEPTISALAKRIETAVRIKNQTISQPTSGTTDSFEEGEL